MLRFINVTDATGGLEISFNIFVGFRAEIGVSSAVGGNRRWNGTCIFLGFPTTAC